MNRGFSAALSLLLGIPQALWRGRHLAHHAGGEWRWRATPQFWMESLLIVAGWAMMATFAAQFFLGVYLPSYVAGLMLCAIQGYWEHTGGRPVSHYGWLYNFFCLNDGFHLEHHATPGVHWSELPSRREAGAMGSRFPALLRWLEVPLLEQLERAVLRRPRLQRFVIRKHRRALEQLLHGCAGVSRITIIGGGLFPRTALILSELLPAAQQTIIDSAAANIAVARAVVPTTVEWRHEYYVAGERLDADLAIVPLCLEGKRRAIYERPPARLVIVHDWIWHRRGTSAVVSIWLLKRVNLVRT